MVILPNITLTAVIRRHPWRRDSHGQPVAPAAPSIQRGPYPCAVKEQDNGDYTVRLDPRMWPMEAGDEVTDGQRTWVLGGRPRKHGVPGHSAVDYIAATATLNPGQVP